MEVEGGGSSLVDDAETGVEALTCGRTGVGTGTGMGEGESLLFSFKREAWIVTEEREGATEVEAGG